MRNSIEAATDTVQDSPTVTFRSDVFRKVSLRLIPFLFLCYCVAYVDRINVAFAKLQMSRELSFGDATFGLGAGIFFLGYFLAEVPSNLVLRRVGARLWIARIMVTWGFFSCLMVLVHTPAEFYAVRLLLGISEAGFFPGVILLLTDWFPAELRGRVTALFVAAVPVGGLLGAPVSGYVMDAFDGWHGLSGWQWMFLSEGVPALILGVACLGVLADSPDHARWLQPAERTIIRDRLARDKDAPEASGFLAALRKPAIWLLCLVNFAIGAGFLGVAFWMPTLLKEAGFSSNLTIGLVSAIPYFVAVVLMVAVGWSSDRFGERRYHLAVPLVVGAAGLVLATWAAPSPSGVVLGLVLTLGGVTTASPMIWSFGTPLIPVEARAGAIALVTSALALAGFVVPYLIGIIREATAGTSSSGNAALYCVASMLVLAAAVVLAVAPARVNMPPAGAP